MPTDKFMKHDNTISSVPTSAKRKFREAISNWVNSLSPQVANKKTLAFGAISYSPAEILYEIENETSFGEEFIAGLYSLSEQLAVENPEISIIDVLNEGMKLD